MQISDACIQKIVQWARRTDSVREVWLFGSRAKGYSGPESDIDLGIYVMPQVTEPGKRHPHNWADAAFLACHEKWEQELSQSVGLPCHLTLVDPDNPGDAEVRGTGKQLWVRT